MVISGFYCHKITTNTIPCFKINSDAGEPIKI